MKQQIEQKVLDFFVNSHDFNGISLRNISEIFSIDYRQSIDIIKELVSEDKISIQSSTNPHIIGMQHYPKQSQLDILEQAKDITVTYREFLNTRIAVENTEYPICLYPSMQLLSEKRNVENYGYAYYSKRLALGEPQLKPIFFDVEVLARYYNDPRFEFQFEDYSGRIYCKYDEQENPMLRDEDDIYLKTFGLGFDKENNRLAVVFLRYLHNLTPEHQIYWKGKERTDDCKVLEEYYQNAILGNWTFSYSLFSAFLGELKCLNDLSKHIFKINLFHESFEDEKRPSEFTFFFIPTLKNYHDFIHVLDKMISENINKSFFKNKIELFTLTEENGINIKENKGTLRLLEEWLTSIFNVKGDGSVAGIIKPFKNVRSERQTPAHKVKENVYDKTLIDKQKETISNVYNSMRQLRNIFSLHPKAKDFEIPDWLENGKLTNL
ncbi:MAG: hypothetical protein EOO46_21505 [Flavobacterium sp.]|nr:MAG: hypothetical protein EOO46_21505 [Flavobacterium sp.]